VHFRFIDDADWFVQILRRSARDGVDSRRRTPRPESAARWASDLFIGHRTRKWIEMHARTGAPVSRYSFDRKPRTREISHRNGV